MKQLKRGVSQPNRTHKVRAGFNIVNKDRTMFLMDRITYPDKNGKMQSRLVPKVVSLAQAEMIKQEQANKGVEVHIVRMEIGHQLVQLARVKAGKTKPEMLVTEEISMEGQTRNIIVTRK